MNKKINIIKKKLILKKYKKNEDITWEDAIILALYENKHRTTSEQFKHYLELIEAASKKSSGLHWSHPIVGILEKGLGVITTSIEFGEEGYGNNLRKFCKIIFRDSSNINI